MIRKQKCPTCGVWLQVPGEAIDRIRCSGCDAVVSIAADPPVDVLEVVSRPTPRRSERDRDEDDPPRRSRSRDDYDEEDRPSRRRYERDEDEEDRPRRRSGSGGRGARRDWDEDREGDPLPEKLLSRGREMSVPLSVLSRELRDKVDETVRKNETIVWVGQPDPKVKALRGIPATIFGGIFALVGSIFVIIGIVSGFLPFVLIAGFFVLIGCLVMATPLFSMMMAKRTCYVLTNRRAIVITWNLVFGISVRSYNKYQVGCMRKQSSWFVARAGDLVMHQETHVHYHGGRHGGVGVHIVQYGFMAIREVDEVEELMQDTLLD
jgi:hypothetical protein